MRAEYHFNGRTDPRDAIEELFEWKKEPVKRRRFLRENAFDVPPNGFTKIVTITMNSRYCVL